MPAYDVCMCYHPKDAFTLEHSVRSIRQNLPDAKTVYIISKEDPEVEGCVWIPESSYPFSKEDVGKIIHCETRVGWYYQQLLKLYCYRVLPSISEHILILDTDVIIREKIDFFEGDKILLGVSPENNVEYFLHMERLLPLKKQTEYSGIVHHMMTKRNHMETILQEIERIHQQPAWKILISLVNPEYYDNSGMSEYEIYFNYCLKNYPTEYKYRILPFANCTSFREVSERKEPLVAIHAWHHW